MRIVFVLAVCWGCSFSPPPPTNGDPDARLGDARFDGGSEDADADAPADSAIPQRVTEGLRGLWTFNEPDGSRTLADTSNSGTPVPLMVEIGSSSALPSISNGSLVASMPARVVSATSTHLTTDCIAAGGVTLEAWAQPIALTTSDPLFVAGLAANILSRDVALLQNGNHWEARVRTTSAADGGPVLSSSVEVGTSMTHLVVVADSSHRALYVNGVMAASSAPGTLLGWDPTYPMGLVDEYQHARQWTGSLALVALYNRALSEAEILQNKAAGPDAP